MSTSLFSLFVTPISHCGQNCLCCSHAALHGLSASPLIIFLLPSDWSFFLFLKNQHFWLASGANSRFRLRPFQVCKVRANVHRTLATFGLQPLRFAENSILVLAKCLSKKNRRTSNKNKLRNCFRLRRFVPLWGGCFLAQQLIVYFIAHTLCFW